MMNKDRAAPRAMVSSATRGAGETTGQRVRREVLMVCAPRLTSAEAALASAVPSCRRLEAGVGSHSASAPCRQWRGRAAAACLSKQSCNYVLHKLLPHRLPDRQHKTAANHSGFDLTPPCRLHVFSVCRQVHTQSAVDSQPRSARLLPRSPPLNVRWLHLQLSSTRVLQR